MLNVIMLNAVMPVAVLSVLIVPLLSVVMLSANMQSLVVLGALQSVVYADCSIYYCYAQCQNAERCYAECSTECGLS
jgi:hypothetical protein